MHMADALVSPAVAGTMYAASTGATIVSIYKIKKENDNKKIPVMGVMGAFVFATQMINFTIPGTGSSGHLCGGMLLSALLGPYAAFLTMIAVLLIQCLLFADGGLLAFGCNVWNMAFYGCFLGALLFWKPFTSKLLTSNEPINRNTMRFRIIGASVLGSMLTLQCGAFSVVLETLISGITELPFSVFVALMQPIHLAIGFVEGLITAAVLIFVYESRPDILWTDAVINEKTNAPKLSFRNTIAVLAVATAIIGGGLSLFASEHPDGLEWSIEKVTGDTELEDDGTAIYQSAANIQETTSLLPDYNFADSEDALGTSFSGVIGSLIVCALCAGICFLLNTFRKRRN